MFKFTLTQRILITLAVVTTVGVLLHDTKFDKAFALALPVVTIGVGISTHAIDFGGSAHTHVERVSIEKANSMTNGLPRVQVRDDHRRYQLPKHVRGFATPR